MRASTTFLYNVVLRQRFGHYKLCVRTVTLDFVMPTLLCILVFIVAPLLQQPSVSLETTHNGVYGGTGDSMMAANSPSSMMLNQPWSTAHLSSSAQSKVRENGPPQAPLVTNKVIQKTSRSGGMRQGDGRRLVFTQYYTPIVQVEMYNSPFIVMSEKTIFMDMYDGLTGNCLRTRSTIRSSYVASKCAEYKLFKAFVQNIKNRLSIPDNEQIDFTDAEIADKNLFSLFNVIPRFIVKPHIRVQLRFPNTTNTNQDQNQDNSDNTAANACNEGEIEKALTEQHVLFEVSIFPLSQLGYMAPEEYLYIVNMLYTSLFEIAVDIPPLYTFNTNVKMHTRTRFPMPGDDPSFPTVADVINGKWCRPETVYKQPIEVSFYNIEDTQTQQLPTAEPDSKRKMNTDMNIGTTPNRHPFVNMKKNESGNGDGPSTAQCVQFVTYNLDPSQMMFARLIFYGLLMALSPSLLYNMYNFIVVYVNSSEFYVSI